MRTTLIERVGPASGATGVAPGILTAGSDARGDPQLDALKASAQRSYAELLAPIRHRLNAEALSWTGSILLAMNEEEEEALREDPRGMLGMPVGTDQLAAIDPSIRSRHGGMWFAHDGHANPVAITRAYLSASMATGRLTVLPADVRQIMRIGGRVAGVRTPHEVVSADTVVCATGCDERGLLAPFGVALEPVRGQILVHASTPRPRVVVRTEDLYSVARGRWVLVGATEERVGYDTNADRTKIRALRDSYARVFGARPRGTIRTGFRSASPDGLPVVGEHPGVAGLFVATGLYRNGVLLGPSAGQAVAAAATTGRIPGAWEPFGVPRLLGATRLSGARA